MALSNILLTNDDGYDAPGLRAAQRAISHLGTVHVVAPRTQQSACSHAITLRSPIMVQRTAHAVLGDIWVVDGSPADCIRLAIAELLDAPIDLVVAGINAGANSGADVHYSGTVAAAREACILQVPSIAVSQATRKEIEVDWDAASAATGALVEQLVRRSLPGPGFWSVNLPPRIPPHATDHVQFVELDQRPVPLSFDRIPGDDNGVMRFLSSSPYWTRPPDESTDYGVIAAGGIAVTAVPLYGRF